ncbi:hypothetical protein TWF696_007407 [Orbilia brochopaga]|uniref:Extracellular serine-rich protein n=1 Tax=Orbilia brochopaga TaxID=3140254 RepID=A0AAV9UTB1_9PEZI
MTTAWVRADGQQRSTTAKSWSLPFYDTEGIAGLFIRSWARLQSDFLNQIRHSSRSILRPASSATNLSFMASFLLLIIGAQRCRADIIDVLVGLRNGDSKLVFTPEVIYQNVGEQVRFRFYPQNHSVAQSSFDSPCAPLGGASSGAGFFSGFNSIDDANQPNPTFTVNITSNEPVYFYCAQGRHCQGGMVGIINPPSADTINVFKAAASKIPFTEIPLTPPNQDLPAPKFSTTSFAGLSEPTTTGTDPQYTPNTPAPKTTTSSGGLSTSGYIAVACIGALLIFIAAIVAWCIVLRRRRRRERGQRMAAHDDQERRRQRGKDVSSRVVQPYRDIEPGMIDLDVITGPSQASYAYSYRRPPAGDPNRHSVVVVQRPKSYVSPNSMSSSSSRRLSANVIHLDHRPSTASMRHYNRMSMPYPPTSSRMSYQGPSTSYSHSRRVPSRRYSTQSIPVHHHRQSILRKPSPTQQAHYDELQRMKAEQKRIEQHRKSLTPGPSRSSPSPPASILPRWKIFKKSTYRRRMEVREIDIHDVNRHQTATSRKPTPSVISRPTVANSGDGVIERNISTRNGTATTAVDTQGRETTSHTADSETMLRNTSAGGG